MRLRRREPVLSAVASDTDSGLAFRSCDYLRRPHHQVEAYRDASPVTPQWNLIYLQPVDLRPPETIFRFLFSSPAHFAGECAGDDFWLTPAFPSFDRRGRESMRIGAGPSRSRGHLCRPRGALGDTTLRTPTWPRYHHRCEHRNSHIASACDMLLKIYALLGSVTRIGATRGSWCRSPRPNSLEGSEEAAAIHAKDFAPTWRIAANWVGRTR
jgi:hypothetical protein